MNRHNPPPGVARKNRRSHASSSKESDRSLLAPPEVSCEGLPTSLASGATATTAAAAYRAIALRGMVRHASQMLTPDHIATTAATNGASGTPNNATNASARGDHPATVAVVGIGVQSTDTLHPYQEALHFH